MSLQPWLMPTWKLLAPRIGRGELPHAVLISGPRGLGKRVLADKLIAAALCEQRGEQGFACASCRACQLLAAGSHPDRVLVTLELRDDGKVRSDILIEQIRALSQRLALSSQFGGLQLALVDPADRMNASAANALLKTLEEPSSRTIIVLVADDPARLPATIRSRCQRFEIKLPAQAEACAWLERSGLDASLARRVLDASLGNPGLALQASQQGVLELKASCRSDLQALGQGRAQALQIAENWVADRPDERLWHAAVIAREESERLANGGEGQLGLQAGAGIAELAAWFAAANRRLQLLSSQVRSDLVLLDLLHTWPSARRS